MILLDHVPVTVALDRMRIYAHTLTADQKQDIMRDVLTGNARSYRAYGSCSEPLGITHIIPEDHGPVTTVSEMNI